MVQLLKKNHPFLLISAFVLGFFMWIAPHGATNFTYESVSDSGFVYSVIACFLYGIEMRWVVVLTSYFLVALQALFILKINLKFSIVGNTTSFLIVFVFFLLNISLPNYYEILPVHFANFFLILAIDEVFVAQTKEKSVNNFFNSSLLIGVATIFCYKYLFLVFFLIIAILLVRGLFTREVPVVVLGFVTVYLIFGAVYFLYFGEIETLIMVLKDQLSVSFPLKEVLINQLVVFVGIALLFLSTFVFSLRNMFEKSIVVRVFLNTINSLVVVLLLMFILFSVKYYLFYFAVIVPVSFVVTNYFFNEKNNTLSNIAFLFLVAIVVYNNFLILGI